MQPFSRSTRKAFILFLSLLLSSCGTSSLLNNSSWETHQNLVSSSTTWTLRGRLNIRQNDRSDTVSINWQQNQEAFEINLSGALGLGSTIIIGDQQRIRLQRGNEEPILAANLMELSRDYLGYEFPTNALIYWVRGIPAPSNLFTLVLNDEQRLASLTQQDSIGNTWQLEYDRYRNIDDLDLPGRIRMQHPEYRLTFIIQSWQVE